MFSFSIEDFLSLFLPCWPAQTLVCTPLHLKLLFLPLVFFRGEKQQTNPTLLVQNLLKGSRKVKCRNGLGNHELCLFFSGTFCFIIFLLTVGSTVERVPDVSSLFARTVLQSEVKMFKSFSLIAATHYFCRQEGDFSVGSCKTPLETERAWDAAVTCAEGFAFCGTLSLSPDKHLAELHRSSPSAADRRQTRFPAVLPCNFGLLSPAGRRFQPSALRRRRSPAFPAADGTRPGAPAAGNRAKKKTQRWRLGGFVLEASPPQGQRL